MRTGLSVYILGKASSFKKDSRKLRTSSRNLFKWEGISAYSSTFIETDWFISYRHENV